jgi:hypothetical protein
VPTWGEILVELQAPESRLPNGTVDFDGVRRKYVSQLSALTGRAVIVYATCFLDKDVPGNLTQITLGDLQGFMECVAGVRERELDLLVTSPGGSAEATESIVTYLRSKFKHIRVFVPVAAMSAATMLALGADEIVMGAHSQLGPIDPQFFILTPEGPRYSPARAILDQFERAKLECQDPKNLAAWLPILRTYAPGLLQQCVDSQEVAERMVRKWLESYMLKGTPNAAKVAELAARWFGDYGYFHSHGRQVTYADVRARKLKASRLEADQALQDAVLSVHHAYAHTFNGTPAAKIIENHLGRAWVKLSGQIFVQAAPPPAPLPPAPGSPASVMPSVPQSSRARAAAKPIRKPR